MSVKRERMGDGMTDREFDEHLVRVGERWVDEGLASSKLHKVHDLVLEAIAEYDEIERWREFDPSRSKAHLNAVYDKFHEMMIELERKE